MEAGGDLDGVHDDQRGDKGDANGEDALHVHHQSAGLTALLQEVLRTTNTTKEGDKESNRNHTHPISPLVSMRCFPPPHLNGGDEGRRHPLLKLNHWRVQIEHFNDLWRGTQEKHVIRTVHTLNIMGLLVLAAILVLNISRVGALCQL